MNTMKTKKVINPDNIATIRIYILNRKENGQNYYLISSGIESKKDLLDLTFFTGTREQAFKKADEIKKMLSDLYGVKK